MRIPIKLLYFGIQVIENDSQLVIIPTITSVLEFAHQQTEVYVSSVARGAYRNTAQRAIILQEVESSDGHLTAGEIFERVKQRYPSIAYGTVYRTLHLLAEHDLIQELTFADQASRFDKRTDRHDHVQCSGCGELIDVVVPISADCEQVAASQSGWHIASHHTLFEGMCPECLAKQEAVS